MSFTVMETVRFATIIQGALRSLVNLGVERRRIMEIIDKAEEAGVTVTADIVNAELDDLDATIAEVKAALPPDPAR